MSEVLGSVVAMQIDSVGREYHDLACGLNRYSAMDVAVSMSLYAYNVSALDRATRLYDHFQGDCGEVDELKAILANRREFSVTELAPPTAVVYVAHALVMYGEEARNRNRINGMSQ